MTPTLIPRNKPSILEGVLALLATILVFATLSLTEAELHLSYRSTLILLVLTGYAMCRVANAHDTPLKKQFSVEYRFILSLLGILSGIFVVAHLFGFDLPMVTTDRQALVMLAATMLVKWMLTAIQRMQK